MKTLVIFMQGDAMCPNYFGVDGDFSHLDGVYVNMSEDYALEDKLMDLLYEEGRLITADKDNLQVLTKNDLQSYFAENKNLVVIHAGFPD